MAVNELCCLCTMSGHLNYNTWKLFSCPSQKFVTQEGKLNFTVQEQKLILNLVKLWIIQNLFTCSAKLIWENFDKL